ncbi:MAG TPA: TonB C-terminal domain-containing protein [Gemmatimonadales bacterium]|nr:TonB C-terminal domain-containing protein [Gemmatimonadales bacterium]
MRRYGARAERMRGATAGLVGTVLVHGLAAALVLTGVRPPRPGPPVYAVNLVAAPAPRPDARRTPEVVEREAARPQPAPPRPEPEPAKPTETAPVPKPRARPRPTPTAPTPPPPEPDVAREPAPRASSPAAPAPGETPGTGDDPVTIQTPGLVFAYPEYLENIVAQVYRRWERPAGTAPLRAEVNFLILKDGGVRDIRFLRRSGDFAFDLSAQGAIEAAGNARAFGPLPDGYEADVLPVTFIFNPRGGR